MSAILAPLALRNDLCGTVLTIGFFDIMIMISYDIQYMVLVFMLKCFMMLVLE